MAHRRWPALVAGLALLVAGFTPLHAAETGQNLTPEQAAALRKVKRIRLVVVEDYGEAKGLRIPELKTMVESMLQAGGLQLARPDDKTVDATLEIRIQGTPLTARTPAGATRYPGAAANCAVELRAGNIRYSQIIEAVQRAEWFNGNPDSLYSKPQESPFRKLLERRLLTKFPPLVSDLFGSDRAKVIAIVLKADDVDLKVRGVNALGKLGESGVGPLSVAIRDSNSQVRIFVVDALEKTASVKAAPVLIAAFSDPDENVSSRAMEASGRLKSAASLEALLAAFASGSKRIRGAAVWGLAPYDDPRAVQALIAALQDTEESVRLRASGILSDKGNAVIKPLTRLLSDQRLEVRSIAVKTLAGMKNKSRIEPLIGALLDADDQIVREANEGLTQYDPDPAPKPFEPLVKVFKNGSLFARKCAANLLPDCQDPRAVEPLLEALKGEPADLRPYAANAFTRLKDKRTIEPLLAALNDKDALLRSQAALALGTQADPRAVERLLTRLTDEDAGVRKSVVLALGKIRDRRALKPLLPILKDDQPEMRAQAAWSLGMIGGIEALEALLESLKDGADSVRWEAAAALGLTGEPKAYEPLIGLLKNEDVHIVDSAVQGLGSLRDMRAVRPLLEGSLHKRIVETEGTMAGTIRQSLQQICGDTLEPILALIGDKDPAVRARALWAINSLGSEAQLDVIFTSVKDAAPEVRRQAAEILVYKKGARGFAILQALLKDPDPGVRYQAAWSLGERKDPAALDALIAALKDSEARVRGGAAEALGKLNDQRAVPYLIAMLKDTGSDVFYSVSLSLRALGQEDEIEAQ